MTDGSAKASRPYINCGLLSKAAETTSCTSIRKNKKTIILKCKIKQISECQDNEKLHLDFAGRTLADIGKKIVKKPKVKLCT